MVCIAQTASSSSKSLRPLPTESSAPTLLTRPRSRAVRKFIRSEEGKKVQEKVYEQISRKLESIQPGIFANIPLS